MGLQHNPEESMTKAEKSQAETKPSIQKARKPCPSQETTVPLEDWSSSKELEIVCFYCMQITPLGWV